MKMEMHPFIVSQHDRIPLHVVTQMGSYIFQSDIPISSRQSQFMIQSMNAKSGTHN